MVKRIYVPSVLAFCALVAAACTPTVEERQFSCNMNEPCPDGFACFSGVCCTSAEACGSPEEDAGTDTGVDASVDAPELDVPTVDAGGDTFVEPDVPGCMSIDPPAITSSMSAVGVITLEMSSAAFAGLSGDAEVSGAGINVRSAVFADGVLTLAYRAPRSVSNLPASGTETIALTITQASACFQMNQGLPVTLGLQVITPNDESTCGVDCGQSVDVASNGTVVFSSRDPLDGDDDDLTSDIYMQEVGEDLRILTQNWPATEQSRHVRIADDGSTIVYSLGTRLGSARVVSQRTASSNAVIQDIRRNCLFMDFNRCYTEPRRPSAFDPVEIMTEPDRIGFFETLTPRAGPNSPNLVRRTGTSDNVVVRGNPFVDIQVNGRIWGFAQEGVVVRAVDGEDDTRIPFSEGTDRGYFPGLDMEDGVFQRGNSVVVVRTRAVVYSFDNSTFLGASADLNRVLVVQDNSLFLLQSMDGMSYAAIAIQNQSTANVLTNLPLANVDRPAALSGNGAWIGALLGSPTRVVRIRVE